MRAKKIFILLFLVSVTRGIYAQPVADTLRAGGNPLVAEQYRTANPYLMRDNASLVLLGERLLYSGISLGTEASDGDFHRPQQPARTNSYLFSAEGSTYLGGFYVSGGFDFRQASERGVQFNSIFDPYRGTPYIIADSTGGDWAKQSYGMWASLASPFVGDRISFGLSVGLDVNRGAKKIDPRPQSNTNRIDLSPSLTLRLGQGHALGGSFLYSRFREKVNLMLYDSSEPQKIYLLKGMGQYTYDIFSGNDRERMYAGDLFGATAQYAYTSARVSLLLGGGYRNELEETTDLEINKPRLRGRFYRTETNAFLRLNIRGDGALHTLRGEYLRQEGSGREIIQVFNPSPQVNAWVTESEAPRRSVTETSRVSAEYALYLHPIDESLYRWKLSLGSTLTDYSDTYDVMYSYMRFRSALTALSAERLFSRQSWYLQAGLSAALHTVWDAALRYTEREEDDRSIADGLVYPDFRVLSAGYASGTLSLTGGYRLPDDRSVWLRVAGGYLRAEDRLSRTSVRLTVGYTF
ncbi:MAG: hypothetical protein LBM20_02680 [Rikenellaceae bacterium]|jgi:hypothetical protein|nr:hypothetical protein [Rikenellaceae bacterium]